MLISVKNHDNIYEQILISISKFASRLTEIYEGRGFKMCRACALLAANQIQWIPLNWSSQIFRAISGGQ
jgi:hypothetical protein